MSKEIIEAAAKKLYNAWAGNHPTIHCNRMAGWYELTKGQQEQWIWTAKIAMPVPSPWRDIESAPKDGTRCLFFAKANKQCFYKSGKKDQIRVDFWKDTGFHKMFPQCPYTHWMPLPDAPESPPS